MRCSLTLRLPPITNGARAGQEVAGSVHVILHHQGTRAQFAQDRTKEIEDCPFVLDLKFFMTAGEVSDSTGAPALLGHMPKAEWLLAAQGYGADWCREALKDRGIRVCIPGRKSRKKDSLRSPPLQKA